MGSKGTGIRRVAFFSAFFLLVTLLRLRLLLLTDLYVPRENVKDRRQKERARGGGELGARGTTTVTVEGRKWRRTRAEKIKRGLKSGD